MASFRVITGHNRRHRRIGVVSQGETDGQHLIQCPALTDLATDDLDTYTKMAKLNWAYCKLLFWA